VSADIPALVRQLRDFRTRTQAQDLLIEAGREAVEPLIQALEDRAEGVRWSAVKCLGAIGDPRAVGPLIRVLGDENMKSIAAEALTALTGQTLGADAEAWHSWLRGEGAARAKPATAGPSAESDRRLVAEALRGVDATVSETKDGYAVVVALDGGRSQKVRLVLDKSDSDGSPLAIVYSECGPAKPEIFEWALHKNLTMPHGALGIRDSSSGPVLVMFHTLLKETASAKELRKSLLTIARHADAVEKALTKQDVR
jgi:hypothetical protein